VPENQDTVQLRKNEQCYDNVKNNLHQEVSTFMSEDKKFIREKLGINEQ
jgi:hypothetical protein